MSVEPYFALGEREDIGHGHMLRPITYTGDEHPCGWELHHPDKRDSSQECGSGVWVARRVPENLWTLVSWEPLTIAPSVLCVTCGDHGFIRDGKWVPA